MDFEGRTVHRAAQVGTPTRPHGSTSSQRRYASELESEEAVAALAELRDVLRAGPVTLVTAARDLDGSHVAVLARLLA